MLRNGDTLAGPPFASQANLRASCACALIAQTVSQSRAQDCLPVFGDQLSTPTRRKFMLQEKTEPNGTGYSATSAQCRVAWAGLYGNAGPAVLSLLGRVDLGFLNSQTTSSGISS